MSKKSQKRARVASEATTKYTPSLGPALPMNGYELDLLSFAPNENVTDHFITKSVQYAAASLLPDKPENVLSICLIICSTQNVRCSHKQARSHWDLLTMLLLPNQLVLKKNSRIVNQLFFYQKSHSSF